MGKSKGTSIASKRVTKVPIRSEVRAPQINVPRLRGLLAERLIPLDEFAEVAGINYTYVASVMSGRQVPGELTRYKLADACDAYGLTGVVGLPDEDELISRLA